MARRMRRGALALLLALALLPGGALAEPAAELPEFELPGYEAAEQMAEEAPAEAIAAEAAMDVAEAGEAAPEPLRLNAGAVTLGVKETFQLRLTEPSRGEGLGFAFVTSNKKVATVSAAGKITAKKKGTATVTVTASDGTQMTCAVTVAKAPGSVKLNAKSATLAYDAATGAALEYRLTATLPKGTASAISYTGYDAAVLAVSPEGLVTPRGVGSTTITAKTFNGKKATCKVTVKAAPQAMAFADPAPALCEGEARTLALALPANALAAARFESDRPEIAAVDPATGAVRALAVGEATITATAFNGVTAECKAAVWPGPDAVALGATSRTLGVGESFALLAWPTRGDGLETVAGLTYATSNKKIATVDGNGLVKGKKAGTAKITVSAPNGVKAVCAVKVAKAPSSVKLNAKAVTLTYDADTGAGGQYQLKATLSKNSASQVTYSGYDPAVVSVAADGTVTALAVGATTVTARTFNGKKASCKVTVKAYVPSYRDTHPLVAVAHRGGGGYWPENTLAAFRNAASTGADAIEMDVHTAADGTQVVNHDQTITMGKAKYDITKCTLSQLRQAKPDICTLDEALEAVADSGLALVLELKQSANSEACMAAVGRHGLAGRTIYISFYQQRLAELRALDAGAKLGFLFEKTPSNLAAVAEAIKADAVMPKYTLATQKLVDAWHAAGLQVGVWTVNDRAKAKALRDMGVDYMVSDYPDYVAAVK